MKAISRTVDWAAESAILASLLYKYYAMVRWHLAVFLVLIVPLFAFVHWRGLKQERLPRMLKWRLFLLTGPCVLVAMTLIAEHAAELRTVAWDGIFTKEMQQAALREHVPHDCYQQWHRDYVGRLKSDTSFEVMLLLSMFFLYQCRCTSAKSAQPSVKMPIEEANRLQVDLR